MKKQSEAAGAIFGWLVAINDYQQITRAIQPKISKLKEIQS
jgi:hypothetical protein